MRVQKIQGLWFPAEDKHFCQHNCASYQNEIYQEALQHVRHKRVAVDIGAHVGIWATRFAMDFDLTYAFEPQRDNYQCLAHNVMGLPVFSMNIALGSDERRAELNNPAPYNSGAWELASSDDGSVPVRPLDSFGLLPDLIKIDTQGYEGEIIDGARETIFRAKPVLVVENNGNAKEWLGWFSGLTTVEIGNDIVAWWS